MDFDSVAYGRMYGNGGRRIPRKDVFQMIGRPDDFVNHPIDPDGPGCSFLSAFAAGLILLIGMGVLFAAGCLNF